MEYELNIDNKKMVSFVLIGLFALISLWMNLNTTFGSNIIFGDEGYHAHLAGWIAENDEIPVYTPLYGTEVYQDYWGRPPFPHLMFAGIFNIFGFSEFWINLMLPVMLVMIGLVAYLFAREYSEYAGLAAFFIVVMTPSLITYAVTFYSEMPFVLFFSLAVYILYKALQGESSLAPLAGVFGGAAVLCKATGIAIFPVFLLAFVWFYMKNKDKNIIKTFVIAFTVLILMSAPYFARNMAFTGNLLSTSMLSGESVEPVESFDGRTDESGTELDILSYGILNYMAFSYGLPVGMLLLLGVIYASLKRDRFSIFMLLWVLIMLGGIFVKGGMVGRVEDTSRYLLPIVIPLAVMSSVFISDALNGLNKKKLFVAGVAALLVFAWFAYGIASEKADTMASVKQFSSSFYKGSEWIENNTPEDSVILSLWTHQTVYTAQRKSFWELPELADILVNPGNRTLEVLERNGIDYIYVQKWSMSPENLRQKYPEPFVNFVARNFNMSYEYPEGCMVDTQQADCVAVFEV